MLGMSSVLDEKRRVTIPKSLAEALNLREGSIVTLTKKEDAILMKKSSRTKDNLDEILSWNPNRKKGKLEKVDEKELKKIWQESE
jgi:AbrB family looped-hinge helix DNA binding protein